MTLHDFLIGHKLILDKKTEVRIGEIISDEYRRLHFISAPKIYCSKIDANLNDYPKSFLENCTHLIEKFLISKYETT